MPLFFFLSGLLLRPTDDGVMTYIKKISQKILYPWAVMFVISFMICLAIPTWRHGLTMHNFIYDIYTSNTNIVQNSSLWYLVCYFWVLIYVLFYHKIKKSKLKTIILVFLLFVTLFLPDLQNEISNNLIKLPGNRLPFKIDSAMIGLVFIILSEKFKKKVMDLPCGLKKFSVRMFGFSIIVLSCTCINGWCNMNSLDFGNHKILYYPIALIGISLICIYSQWISSSDFCSLKRILCFYGKNSLIIFGFQSLLIRLYLLVFNNIQGLGMKLYADNPVAHQIGCFLFVTFIGTPFVVFLYKWSKKKMMSYCTFGNV